MCGVHVYVYITMCTDYAMNAGRRQEDNNGCKSSAKPRDGQPTAGISLGESWDNDHFAFALITIILHCCSNSLDLST